MSKTNDQNPHPAVGHVLQFFKWEHLPEKLQLVSRPFATLAEQMVFGSAGVGRIPQNQELTVALRKLLESKDAAVRAALLGEPEIRISKGDVGP